MRAGYGERVDKLLSLVMEGTAPDDGEVTRPSEMIDLAMALFDQVGLKLEAQTMIHEVIENAKELDPKLADLLERDGDEETEEDDLTCCECDQSLGVTAACTNKDCSEYDPEEESDG